MVAEFNVELYSDALVVLGTAGIIVPLVRRCGISPVLGYLGAGAILGPLGLGSLKGQFPFLYWLTVVDAKSVAGIAELGVVFLLFFIGLQLTYERLLTMRRLVFGLGSLQVLLSATAIGILAKLAGISAAVAITLGACLALSSTAVVIELLSNERRLGTTTGRTCFSVLLAQDLAVVPVLFFISILGAGPDSSALSGLVWALLNAVLVLGLIVAIGRVVLRPLFRLVASSGTGELFVAATLFVIVGTAMSAALAGLSMPLGAFVAGLLLAETAYAKAIESTIDPFKGLLLGAFFFTVGMNIDFRELTDNPLWLLACIIGLVVIKFSILAPLARFFGVSWPASIETALLLAPGGEFAFVGIGMAATLGVMDSTVASLALSVTAFSMILIPIFSSAIRRSSTKRDKLELDPELAAQPESTKGHAIVIGYGRVGQVVSTLLERHQFPFVAVDSDPAAVSEYRRRGRQVFYGDATKSAFMTSCGIMEAAGVIITTGSSTAADEIVRLVRELRPDIPIVARTRDAAHARRLYAAGVTDAVPETMESSLQLSEAALVELGLPMGLIITSIHEMRDEFRKELRDAARHAELQRSHSVVKGPSSSRRNSSSSITD